MKTLCISIGLGFLMSALPFATATAQEGASSIEEITVTARKRDESLQEVPIAITAFTEQTIERGFHFANAKCHDS